jgi:hypothetical protein
MHICLWVARLERLYRFCVIHCCRRLTDTHQRCRGAIGPSHCLSVKEKAHVRCNWTYASGCSQPKQLEPPVAELFSTHHNISNFHPAACCPFKITHLFHSATHSYWCHCAYKLRGSSVVWFSDTRQRRSRSRVQNISSSCGLTDLAVWMVPVSLLCPLFWPGVYVFTLSCSKFWYPGLGCWGVSSVIPRSVGITPYNRPWPLPSATLPIHVSQWCSQSALHVCVQLRKLTN